MRAYRGRREWFLHGIYRDLSTDNLKLPSALKFFSQLEKNIRFVNSQYVEPSELINPTVDCWQPSLALRGKYGPALGDPANRLSTIMTTRDLIEHGYLTKTSTLRTDELKLADQIESSVLRAKHLHGELRTGRPFRWVTRSQEIQQVFKNKCPHSPLPNIHEDPRCSIANEVRDKLGLFRKDEGILVEVKYPKDVKLDRIRRPTVLDAGATWLYRTPKFKAPWGAAVDLNTRADGFPEAVHSPCNIDGAFDLRVLGAISLPANRPNYPLLTAESLSEL